MNKRQLKKAIKDAAANAGVRLSRRNINNLAKAAAMVGVMPVAVRVTMPTDTVDMGYKVIYPDGYESWSTQDVFEEAYRETSGMKFGLAIEAAKKGARIARRGWNGKGMFLYHVPAAAYPPSTDVAKVAFGGENVPYGSYIAMKTAQGNVVPWLASQTDMLADDWYIV